MVDAATCETTENNVTIAIALRAKARKAEAAPRNRNESETRVESGIKYTKDTHVTTFLKHTHNIYPHVCSPIN